MDLFLLLNGSFCCFLFFSCFFPHHNSSDRMSLMNSVTPSIHAVVLLYTLSYAVCVRYCVCIGQMVN